MPESVVTVGKQDVVQTSKESGMSTFALIIIIMSSVGVFLLLSAAAFKGFSKRPAMKFTRPAPNSTLT